MDRYHSPEKIDSIGEILLSILKDYYSDPEMSPVINYKEKNRILKDYYRKCPPEETEDFENLLFDFKERVLRDSVKTQHPHFMNQMTAGAPLPSVIGGCLESMLNTTMATWEMSPAATVIEKNVLDWMAQIVGMPEGSSGIFLPGGSLANIVALTIARNTRLDKNISEKGVKHAEQGAVMCAESAHYSLMNAVDILGIGTDNLIKVKTNERNEMLPDDFLDKLKACKPKGIKPFAAVITAGSTLTGGCDPIEPLVKICKENDIHIHIDAAFGGGMALTSRGKKFFKGVEHADSFCWNAHKWFHVPLTCTALLVPDVKVLKENFSRKAPYLFHPQNEELNIFEDQGKYTILCGKRFDALKIWFIWRTYGTKKLRETAEERMNVTDSFYKYIKKTPDFEPCYSPVTPLLCFKHIPDSRKDITAGFSDEMHRWVRGEMIKRGKAFFNAVNLKGSYCFRMVFINPLTKMDHLKKLLDEIRVPAGEYIKNNS